MIIETKFEIGDTVWYMLDNKVANSKIHSIKINVENSRFTHITYNIGWVTTAFSSTYVYKEDKDIFTTKQDLLDSL